MTPDLEALVVAYVPMYVSVESSEVSGSALPVPVQATGTPTNVPLDVHILWVMFSLGSPCLRSANAEAR